MAKLGWSIVAVAAFGVVMAVYSNQQANDRAHGIVRLKNIKRQHRVDKLIEDTGASDGWQEGFTNKQILSADIDRVVVGRPLIFYADVEDVRKDGKTTVILMHTTIGGVLGRTVKLKLRAGEIEASMVKRENGSIISRLTSGYAVAARIDAVTTFDLPDGEGGLEIVSVASGELLGITPFEGVLFGQPSRVRPARER